ncbi:MAG: hypothetical protein WDM90_15620 [Ferruginibacter sp.]
MNKTLCKVACGGWAIKTGAITVMLIMKSPIMAAKMYILPVCILGTTENHLRRIYNFQVTPNTATFQARYVITHPADWRFNL